MGGLVPFLPPWIVNLNQTQAFGLLMAYSLVYVLPLYAFVDTRPSPGRTRDALEAIRARVRTVSYSTTVCSLATFLLLQQICRQSPFIAFDCNPWHLMGYWPLGLVEAARACLLTCLLFAGPLYESLLIEGAWRQWVSGFEPLRNLWTEWPAWRNTVAGPVTEECLFRSAAVPLLLLAGSSQSQIIFLSPIVFGLAHVHHFYEFRITHPQAPMSVAVIRSVLQFSYTSLFGAYATFLFLRTGSLLAVILVHAFCNSMGLPRFWGPVEPYWMPPITLVRPRSAFVWTSIYYVLLLGGFSIWWKNLYILTRSPIGLTDFDHT